jgi:hypothetical protein
MKRYKKEYLKSLKISGFKWDMDPLEMYNVCDDSEEIIKVSKRDLKKLLNIAMLRDINKQRIINSLSKQIGY